MPCMVGDAIYRIPTMRIKDRHCELCKPVWNLVSASKSLIAVIRRQAALAGALPAKLAYPLLLRFHQ